MIRTVGICEFITHVRFDWNGFGIGDVTKISGQKLFDAFRSTYAAACLSNNCSTTPLVRRIRKGIRRQTVANRCFAVTDERINSTTGRRAMFEHPPSTRRVPSDRHADNVRIVRYGYFFFTLSCSLRSSCSVILLLIVPAVNDSTQ